MASFLHLSIGTLEAEGKANRERGPFGKEIRTSRFAARRYLWLELSRVVTGAVAEPFPKPNPHNALET